MRIGFLVFSAFASLVGTCGISFLTVDMFWEGACAPPVELVLSVWASAAVITFGALYFICGKSFHD